MPVQSPLAVQLVGLFDADQLSTVELPGLIGPTGFADKFTIGSPAYADGTAITSAVAGTSPLSPLLLTQLSLK